MILGLGGLLILIGTIWLVITAIQTGETTGDKVIWALVNFLCQPLGGIVYFLVKKQGMIPLILVIVGYLIGGYGYSSSLGGVNIPATTAP